VTAVSNLKMSSIHFKSNWILLITKSSTTLGHRSMKFTAHLHSVQRLKISETLFTAF